MHALAFRELLVEGPKTALLDAGNGALDRRILPLLEEELQRSSTRLQRLKEYRNSLASPIYGLQPEILSHIISIYAHDNDALFDLGWTRLLLVCKRWYDIAKDIQSLWGFSNVAMAPQIYPEPGLPHITKSDARDIRRIEAQRSRVGRAPLTLKMRLFGHLPEEKLAYAYMFWDPLSIRSLDVGGEGSYIRNIAHSMSAHSHPQLEVLQMHCHRSVTPTSALTGVDVALNTLLKNKVPKLRDLSILSLSFDTSLLHGLRRLNLDYSQYGMQTGMPTTIELRDIIATLHRCPQLEALTVALAPGPPNSQLDTGVETSAVVPMSHLNTIIVQATSNVCLALLQAITDVPKSARMMITAVDAPDILSVSLLASCLGDQASVDGAPAIRSVAITRTLLPTVFPWPPDNVEMNPPIARSRIGVVAHKRPSHLNSLVPRRPLEAHEKEADLCIGLEVEVQGIAVKDVLSKTLHFWPLSTATHLDLRSTEVDTDHLNILLWNASPFTTVISQPESQKAQLLLETLCTHLQEYGRSVIANIIFDASNLAAYPAHTGDSARGLLMRILVYCAATARAGIPLDTIEIINEPRDKLRIISSPINEVNWDELFQDLREGFIYEGVIHSSRPDVNGTKRDSFAVPDE